MSTLNFSHLKLLAIFACVVDCKSFAQAARQVGSSRSRISEQVAQLEKDLGVRLLQRTTRKLSLTPEGQTIYSSARALPEVLNTVDGIMQPNKPSGPVAVTLNHDIAHKFLLPALNRFKRTYPDIQLHLVLDDERVDLIDEQVDIAIRIGLPRDDSTIARPLHKECFALFASPNLLQRVGTPTNRDELLNMPWVQLVQHTKNAALALRDGQGQLDLTKVQSTSSNSPLMVQKMAEMGLGVAALLPSTVKDKIEKSALVPICPDVTSEELVFSLVYPSRKQIPLRTRAVIDFLLSENLFNLPMPPRK